MVRPFGLGMLLFLQPLVEGGFPKENPPPHLDTREAKPIKCCFGYTKILRRLFAGHEYVRLNALITHSIFSYTYRFASVGLRIVKNAM
jgi:hypothetical protein